VACNAYGFLANGTNKNPDLAFEFVKSLVGEQGSKAWAKEGGFFMAHRKAQTEWAQQRGPSKNSQVVPDMMEWARLEQARLPGFTEAVQPINREWNAVLNGQRSLSAAVAIAVPEAQAALERARSR
jgi:ABC-type glycerol-3-phosphate transport system substrate-binding protein